MGLRSLGSCVHIQVALLGAQISNSDKVNFKRNFVTLGHDNFMAVPEADEIDHEGPDLGKISF